MNEEQSSEKLNDGNPFVGAKPYGQNDPTLFAGRDKEISDIGFQVLDEPVFLVYGESGVGKTSLINAGLTKWMAEREAILYYCNCLSMNQADVWNDIFKNFDNFINHPRMAEQRPVICFDSFERIIDQTKNDSLARAKFGEFAKRILDTPDTSIVLMLRSEWLAHLELYERLLPNSLKARYRIDPLAKQTAQEVIVDVAEKSAHPFDDTGAQWVINKITNASDESVDMTILQTVCQWIWNKAEKSQIISADELEKLNNEEAIVEVSLKAVYEKILEEIKIVEEQLKFRDWLGTAISINDTGEIVPKVVLRDLTRSFQTTIDALETSHILRRVAVRTKTKAPILFELAHDLWVKIISDSNKEYKQINKKLPFRDQLIQGVMPDNTLKKRLNTIIVNIRAKEDNNYAKFLSSLWEDIDTYKPEEVRDRNRRQAETYIGLDVLEGEGELDFAWFSEETYYHLEGVLVRDAEYFRAYLLWEKDGREYDASPDQTQSKRYFYYTSGSLKQRMHKRDIKIPHFGNSYEALAQYLNDIITPKDGYTGNEWEKANEWRHKIVILKARWLEENRRWCGRPVSDEKNWEDAVEYSKHFYTAVYQLIKKDKNAAEDEKSVKDKAIDDLKLAINFEDKQALISCFEAAILMYYASPELVETAGLAGIFD